MRHNIVVRVIIVQEVINNRFVGLNPRPHFNVLFLTVQSDNREAMANTLAAVIRENISEDSVLMVSCSKSSENYRATVDAGGPETNAV